MEQNDIYNWVIKNVEPISTGYRCAAILDDGLYLPCVVISSSNRQVDGAIRRFDETKNNFKLHESVGYRSVVKSFVTRGNRINYYNIKQLELSDYALSAFRLAEINGETSMGWTEFYVTMDDGKEFCYGTTFTIEFFCMPEGYTASNVVRITPAIRGEPRKYEKYIENDHFLCAILIIFST